MFKRGKNQNVFLDNYCCDSLLQFESNPASTSVPANFVSMLSSLSREREELFLLQHPEHFFALFTDLLAKPVVVVFILIAFLFGKRLDAFGISGVGELDEHAIVMARARAELEIFRAARHGLGTGDADDIDSLPRKRDVTIHRTVRFLLVRIAHQDRHRPPIG